MFDPRKTFFEQKVLWAVVTFLTTIAIILGAILVFNSDLKLDLTHKGFNNFLSIFRLPLGILALLIPIIALLAANHRSSQTKAQLDSTLEQNNFSNYFKHLEEFTLYYREQQPKKSLELLSPRKVYSKLFPLSQSGNYQVDPELLTTLSEIFIDIRNKLESLESNNEPAEVLIEAYVLSKEALEKVELATDLGVSKITTKVGGLKRIIPKSSHITLFAIQESAKVITSFLVFDIHCELPSSLKDVSSMNYQHTQNYQLNDFSEVENFEIIFS